MKRILFIAPHSFPISSSESICNSKIAYTLADMGYKVDVFSCVDPYHYPDSGSLDTVLSTHKNLKVFHVKKKPSITRNGGCLQNAISLFSHIKGYIKTGYFYNGAILPYELLKAIQNEIKITGHFPYDYMITRGFRTEITGIALKKKYGVYWIANWNDPYTEEKFPPPYGKGPFAKLDFFKRKIYSAVQKYVDVHTFPSSRLRDYMLLCFEEVKIQDTFVIPHMAMSKLFSFSTKSKEVLSLVHCGNVRYPRDPSNFLQALSIVKKQGLLNQVKMKVCFIGMYSDSLPSSIKDLGLIDYIELMGMRSYDECQRILANSTVSLIIEAECEEGIYLPTKFVDSLQVSTPVFCVSPSKGTLNDIVSEYSVGYVCNNEDVDDIKDKLIELLEDFRNEKIPVVDKRTAPYFFDDNIRKLYNKVLKQ